MRYASLDGTRLSRIGLGSWAMGGAGWQASLGAQADTDSAAVITAAAEAGVNWIDTAPYYGLGHVEELIGSALRSMAGSDRPMVFTKCGIVWDDREAPPRELVTRANIRAECEGSLRRLGVPQLDLLQIHWPATDGTPVEESWGAMAELADQGLTRWIGVSNFGPGLLDRCERIRHVDTLQPSFSLLRRGAGADVIPWCADHGTAVLAYSPLETGMLAGGYSRSRAAGLDPGDVRLERASIFCEPDLSRNLALVDRLAGIAARGGLTLAELAAGWVLSWPGVTAAILGARTPAQLTGWSAHGSETLPGGLIAEITEALVATGAGAGPVAVTGPPAPRRSP
jgi:aryl-alcohol dehydrogenase-like predicted oxidoreductase